MILRPSRSLLAPTRQVPLGRLQIDHSHRMARNLILCIVPGAMGPIDLSARNNTMVEQAASAIAPSPEGTGLYSNTTSSGYYFDCGANSVFKLTTTNPLTYYWRGFQIATGLADGTSYFGGIYNTAGDSPYVIAGIDYTTSGDVFRANWSQSGSFTNVLFSIGPTANTLFGIGVTFDPSSNVTKYINGVSDGTEAHNGTDSSDNSQSYITLGMHKGITTRNIKAVTLLGCCWNRVLSAEEMRQIHLTPYEMFIPDEPEMAILQETAAPSGRIFRLAGYGGGLVGPQVGLAG